ncbi:MAG: class I SAM-dependent methyltransferase [Defluviitaleaceae bacterium]|nr:class I SAM-dependent methyltransferase [Defluviitaleaceae bacterium]
MLYQAFLTHNQKPITKWLHYFPVYERHFNRFINQSIVFWEIGVAKGGSLQMWKRYFGPLAKIIGIDIRPECKNHEEDQITVCVGDSKDTAFLQKIIDAYGYPDIILDDGSHLMSDVCAAFNFLYDKVTKNGVYMVEDMHTSYWEKFEGGLKKEGTFIELCKSLADHMNARYNGLPRLFAETTFSMSFYDSMVVFEKSRMLDENIKAIKMPGNEPGFAQGLYDKVVFYGCGQYLRELLKIKDLYVTPDEIWDVNAENINKNNISFLCDIPLVKPDFCAANKEKIAVFITVADEAARRTIKKTLNDCGFFNIFNI